MGNYMLPPFGEHKNTEFQKKKIQHKERKTEKNAQSLVEDMRRFHQ